MHSIFYDKHYVLSYSKLFSFVCFDVRVLSAIVVKCKFISSGEISFIVDDCFGTDPFVRWLVALHTDLQFNSV